MAEQTSQQASQETTAKDNEQKQRQPKKMVSSTVKDVVSKGRTMTGKKPDQIDINPVKENSDLFKHVSDVYDKFLEDVDRTDTYKREWGTDSLTNMYKNDTPGQTVNSKFGLQFKNPQKDKEAVFRSGNPDRKEMDIVPRSDPERDRKTDSSFFRQQAVVRRRKDVGEAYGKGYKSPWDKIEKAKPGIGKRIDDAAAGLKQSQKDYQAILDKEKKEKETRSESINASVSGGMRGLGHNTGSGDGESSNYVDQNIADADTKDNLLKQLLRAHLGMHVVGDKEAPADKSDKKVAKEEKEVWDKPNPKKTHKHLTPAQIAKAKARARAAGRPYPNLIDNMAVAKEEKLNQDFANTIQELSAELVGKVNKARSLGDKPSKSQAASKALSNAVRKAWINSKVGRSKDEK